MRHAAKVLMQGPGDGSASGLLLQRVLVRPMTRISSWARQNCVASLLVLSAAWGEGAPQECMMQWRLSPANEPIGPKKTRRCLTS